MYTNRNTSVKINIFHEKWLGELGKYMDEAPKPLPPEYRSSSPDYKKYWLLPEPPRAPIQKQAWKKCYDQFDVVFCLPSKQRWSGISNSTQWLKPPKDNVDKLFLLNDDLHDKKENVIKQMRIRMEERLKMAGKNLPEAISLADEYVKKYGKQQLHMIDTFASVEGMRTERAKWRAEFFTNLGIKESPLQEWNKTDILQAPIHANTENPWDIKSISPNSPNTDHTQEKSGVTQGETPEWGISPNIPDDGLEDIVSAREEYIEIREAIQIEESRQYEAEVMKYIDPEGKKDVSLSPWSHESDESIWSLKNMDFINPDRAIEDIASMNMNDSRRVHTEAWDVIISRSANGEYIFQSWDGEYMICKKNELKDTLPLLQECMKTPLIRRLMTMGDTAFDIFRQRIQRKYGQVLHMDKPEEQIRAMLIELFALASGGRDTLWEGSNNISNTFLRPPSTLMSIQKKLLESGGVEREVLSRWLADTGIFDMETRRFRTTSLLSRI